MGTIIAVANQKGGVGKTTTAVNLAASLAAAHQRVLLIDCDPQGNATVACGINKAALEHSVTTLLLETCTAQTAIMPTPWQFELLPSNGNLTVAEVRLLNTERREEVLKRQLQPVLANYDFMLIDCPPALNMLTVNALTAANSILVPMQCEYFALEGLTSLLSTLDNLRQTTNPTLRLEGILRTLYDGRNRLTVEVSAELHEHFGERVYQTVIPRNVRLAEAPSHGMPVLHYDKSSHGALAYLALAGELMHHYAPATPVPL